VVLPRNTEEVAAVISLAQQEGIPVVPRGAGTGVAGGAVPVSGGIVLDLSAMARIVRIDPDELMAVVEPGVVWAELNRALDSHRLFAPSVPGSGRVSTVGGAVATGGSGMRSLKYGTVREQVRRLVAVLPDGQTVGLGELAPKSACGYSLKDLFVGSEGTLGVITEVALRVWPKPPATLLVEAELRRLEEAPAILHRLRQEGLVPSAFELIPLATLQAVGESLEGGEGRLLTEFQGSPAEVEGAEATILPLLANRRTQVWRTEPEQARRWQRYGEIYFRLVRLKPAPLAEDLGVPVGAVPRLLDQAGRLSQALNLPAGLISHAGDGTVHCVIPADRRDPEEWRKAQHLREELYRLALELGGTITAEHGLGAVRSPFARRQLGPALDLMRRIKQALDPKCIMNPGKLRLEE
jgi:glycolate oxidase